MLKITGKFICIISLCFIAFCSYVNNADTNNEAFKISQDNSDEAIKKFKTVTGLTIKEVEFRARPCMYTSWEHCSEKGFLGKNETFVKRLLIDNRYVHSKGLTHKKLAEPLIAMRKLDPKYCKEFSSPKGPSAKCTFNGRTFVTEILCTSGVQPSIFNDKLRSSCIVLVYKMSKGKRIDTLEYDADLIPNYIRLYGFYEGNTPHRISPKRIISFFRLKK